MEHNVEQHHAFTPGLEEFGQYAKDCLAKTKTFDATTFIGLIDRFAPVLAAHLQHEIQTLLSLGEYNVKEIKKAYLVLAEDAQKASKVRSSNGPRECYV